MTEFKNFIKKHNLILRYLLVITTIASSYIFTITFIQLGLPNFGTIDLGLDKDFVNKTIGLLGMVGGLFAYIGGKVLGKSRNKINLIILIRALAIVVALMARSFAPMITSSSGYFIWVIFMGMVMGFGTPFSYSLTFLLLPPKNRGFVGGIITAVIYGIAAMTLPSTWSLEAFLHGSIAPLLLAYFSYIMLLIFVLGTPVSQAESDANTGEKPYRDYSIKKILIVLTLVLFVDSFGFIRLVMGTEDFANLTWHGELPMLIYIGSVHIISALFFGRIYDKKSPVFVIKTSLILFFIADIIFVLFYGIPELETALAYLFVLFYASAVSIYTIVYIMLAADAVTKETMGKVYGSYTAIVGWIASFISTGIALAMIGLVPVKTHILLAGVLSIVAFFILHTVFKDKALNN